MTALKPKDVDAPPRCALCGKGIHPKSRAGVIHVNVERSIPYLAFCTAAERDAWVFEQQKAQRLGTSLPLLITRPTLQKDRSTYIPKERKKKRRFQFNEY